MKTAVLLIAQSRPRETERVVEAVRSANAQRVYVATDGPRPGVSDEADRCRRVQEVLRSAPWPGEVQYLAAKENLGARLRVPSAIDWVFQDVDRLIILEDDCVPDLTFFRFCDELLERYRTDSRVMMVAGTNPAPWRGRGPSYRFSSYGTVWGWATWARAWRHFHDARELVDDPSTDLKALAEGAWRSPPERRFWENIYVGLRDGGRTWSNSGWDYEWMLARVLEGGLAAMPRANLVTNIGFGKAATDTHTGYAHPIGRLQRGKMRFPLIEPEEVQADAYLDAVLRAGHLQTKIPGFRGRVRRVVARVRGKIDYTLRRNELSH